MSGALDPSTIRGGYPFFGSDGSNPVALSTRVRLVRNVATVPFPLLADEAVFDDFAARLNQLFNNARYLDLRHVSARTRQFLLERRLLPPEFLQTRNLGLLELSPSLHVLLFAGDHFHISALDKAMAFESCLNQANNVSSTLEKVFELARNQQYGFLTSSLRNVGTGMNASVLLHLPALMITQKITPLIRACAELNLRVTGITLPQEEIMGNLFIVGSTITLGVSQRRIIGELTKTITILCDEELKARDFLLRNQRELLLDSISRAYGMLRSARLLQYKEALFALSRLRLGMDLGLFRSLSDENVNALFAIVERENIRGMNADTLPDNQIAAARAEYVRMLLNQNYGNGAKPGN